VIAAIQQRGADPERVVDAVASALRAQLGGGTLAASLRAFAISARRLNTLRATAETSCGRAGWRDGPERARPRRSLA
jgi:hypothetical protein